MRTPAQSAILKRQVSETARLLRIFTPCAVPVHPIPAQHEFAPPVPDPSMPSPCDATRDIESSDDFDPSAHFTGKCTTVSSSFSGVSSGSFS